MRRASVRVAQLVSLLALGYASLFIGVFDIPLLTPWVWSADDLEILRQSRAPRLLSILVAGAGLSISGLIMQSITRNRFVSPTTAGTLEWCKFGVMLAMLALPDAPALAKVGAAFALALAGTGLFLGVISRINASSVVLVPLAGMMLGSVVDAVATFFAYANDMNQNLASWLQGNFSLVVEGSYELLYVSLPFLALAYVYADRFTIAGMGKSVSASLGLDHGRVMVTGLVLVSLISAVTIVEVGYIPFLGLVVPNLVRIYRGDNVRGTLFDTAWLGAVMVLACDVVGRVVIYPAEVPISLIFAVLGSALFLTLILRKQAGAA